MEEAQEFAPEGEESEDTFQNEEILVLEKFEDAFTQARELAIHLLAFKSVQVGLDELVLDIRALETTLSDRPDGDHTHRFDVIESAYSSLRQEWRKAGLPSVHPLKTELDSCTIRIHALAADIAAAKLRAITPSVPAPTHSVAPVRPDRSYTKLPAIALPTFHGDVLKWPTFWNKFQAAVDSNGDLPDSTKLSYLRSAIKDPEAEIILNPSIDGPDTYSRLVRELQQRYERTKQIHRELVEKLVHLPSAKHNSTDLRRLVDATVNCIDCLQTTGHFTLQAVISSLVYSKLPYKLQIDWDDDQEDDNCVQPYNKLLDYINRKAFTLADHKSSNNTPSTNTHSERKPAKRQEQPSQPRKTPVYSVSSPVPSTSTPSPTHSAYRWDCSYCKPEKHPLHLCPKWLGFSIEQRLTQVRDRKLCSNCLSVGHATTVCKSTYRCRECGDNHHTTIHKPTPSAIIPVNTAIFKSQQLPDALLMTAMVLLKGPNGKQTKARAFLDPGAGLSLVSDHIAQTLDLPLESSATTFAAIQGTKCQGSRYLTNLTISSLHQPKEFQCRPAVVQKVTESIPNKVLASVEEFPHLRNLQLADPGFNVPGRVDILLGADLWLQLQGTAPPIIASTSEPGAQDTVFGWVLAGPIHSKDEGPTTVPTCELQQPMTEEPEALLPVQDQQVNKHSNHVVSASQVCRYQATLPRNQNYQPLGESKLQQTLLNTSNTPSESSLLPTPSESSLLTISSELQQDSESKIKSPSIHPWSSTRTTTRSIIMDASTNFDVLVWTPPAALPRKSLFQDLWEKDQERDGSAPLPAINQPAQCKQQPLCLYTKHLPRCQTSQQLTTITTPELQVFSDTSQKPLGAVVSLSTTSTQHLPTISMVTTTEVAKRNSSFTILQLQPSGVVLINKLPNHSAAVPGFPIYLTTAWTDNIILDWLDDTPRESTNSVSTQAFYSFNLPQLLQHSIQWLGPDCLPQDSVSLPPQPPKRLPPEDHHPQPPATLQQAELTSLSDTNINQHSVILSMVAWCFQLFSRLEEHRPDPNTRSKRLSLLEYQTAEQWLFQQLQRRFLPKEQQALSKGLRPSSTSKLKPLPPTLDKTVINRVGGRLGHSKLATPQQHPVSLFLSEHIFLSYCSQNLLLHAIISQIEACLKSRPQTLLHNHSQIEACLKSRPLTLLHSLSQDATPPSTDGHFLFIKSLSTYPILLLYHSNVLLHLLSANRSTKDTCNSCVLCKRIKHKPSPQLMGDLPLGKSQALLQPAVAKAKPRPSTKLPLLYSNKRPQDVFQPSSPGSMFGPEASSPKQDACSTPAAAPEPAPPPLHSAVCQTRC